MSLLQFDKNYSNINNLPSELEFPKRSIVGIDEAGRGCLAGPVYAAAAMLKNTDVHNNYIFDIIDDSKKLSEKNRIKAYELILKYFEVSIGTASAAEIDHINILQATKLAMRRAYENLTHKLQGTNHVIIIDGNFSPFENNFHIKHDYLVGGDSKSLAIAAAGIVAKVMRDVYMKEISEEYPDYMWQSNKGYGTKDHMNIIDEIGITIHHRKTFIKHQKRLEFS